MVPARTYLDTLCDSELETVVPWLSRYPYRDKWEHPFSDYDLWCLVAQKNPFQRPCTELLSNRVLPANILVYIAHIAEHCNFEDWNFGELLREWSIESFAKSCGALKSISFDSLSGSPKAVEMGYKHLMETVGEHLIALSLRCPPNWMWMPIQKTCPNLRKLHISCKSAEATRSSFWAKVGRGLEELKIELPFESLRGLSREKTNMRRLTKSLKLHCRNLKQLTLNGIREGSSIMGECVKSFPVLERTELGAKFWEYDAMELVAERCENVRVSLTFGNPEVRPLSEAGVAPVIESFGDRVDELVLLDNVWFKTTINIPDFGRALNKCVNVKRFSTQSRVSTRMMLAQPKLELREFSCTAQLTVMHITALAMGTRMLRKLHLQSVSPKVPTYVWKDLMYANKATLEEMEVRTCRPSDMRQSSIREMNSFTNGMVDKFTKLLQAMVDLPELYVFNLDVGGVNMGKGEITQFRNACVRLRCRRIRVSVNGSLLLPTGSPTTVSC